MSTTTPSAPATSKPWETPEWFRDRHYAFGLCRACGFRAAYPINDLDNFDGPYFHCLSCNSRGRMTACEPVDADDMDLLVKADRLVNYVPRVVVQEEWDVNAGRVAHRLRYDKELDRLVPDLREYGFETPKQERPEGRLRRDKATGKLVPFPKRAP